MDETLAKIFSKYLIIPFIFIPSLLHCHLKIITSPKNIHFSQKETLISYRNNICQQQTYKSEPLFRSRFLLMLQPTCHVFQSTLFPLHCTCNMQEKHSFAHHYAFCSKYHIRMTSLVCGNNGIVICSDPPNFSTRVVACGIQTHYIYRTTRL